MALEWSDGQDDLEWRNSVVAYAKKGDIDLAEIPIHDVGKLVDGVKDAEIPARVEADQWDFKKTDKEFEARYGTKKRSNGKLTLGGTPYDITKMSSEERSSYNFDHEDPLADLLKNMPKGAFLEIRRG